MEVTLSLYEWPLVVARWPGDGGLEDIDRYYAQYPELIRRGRADGPIVFITDLQKVSMTGTNATKRQHVAKHTAKYIPELTPLIRREAVIASSAWAKASMTAVFMFSKPAWELKVFTDERDARLWLAAVEPAVRLDPD